MLLRLLNIRENKDIECALVNFWRISGRMELLRIPMVRVALKERRVLLYRFEICAVMGMKYTLDLQIRTSKIFVLERNMIN